LTKGGQNRFCLGVVGTSGEEEVEKAHGRVNMVQILHIQVCKWNNETIPEMVHQERRINKNDGEVDSSMIYFIYCKNICKCHNVTPPSTIKNK
jgi:hypothetical protein